MVIRNVSSVPVKIKHKASSYLLAPEASISIDQIGFDECMNDIMEKFSQGLIHLSFDDTFDANFNSLEEPKIKDESISEPDVRFKNIHLLHFEE